MNVPTRRSVLRGSLAVAAAGTLARPYIANAAASTATVWWTQGFVPEEDAAFRKIVADYEKASGNTIDYSLVPFAPLMQKIVSAITSGDVPDLISHDINDQVIVPQNAWNDKVVDVTDVVEAQKSNYHPTVYLASQYYNNVKKQRSFYLIPYKTAVVPFHIWRSLVEKGGGKVADAPKTWDAFWDYFKPIQKKLRDQGMRSVYSLGMQATTTGPADGNNLFHAFLIANGGNGIVTKDGKPHLDDPQIKEAIVKSIAYIATAYKDGYVPPGALSWNDADDNNAFHSKLMVMDFDGTISTEVALYHDKEQYNDIATLGLPAKNDGKPNAAQLGVGGSIIPTGAKNVEVAKDFMKFLIQPAVMNAYLKQGLGRWLPAYPSLVKSDPFWLDPSDPHRPNYVREGLIDETSVNYPVFNPGWSEVNATQIWGSAEADVIRNGMTPEQAADSALKKIETILAKYPIVQS
ncbi:MAG TPA: ABC transporter substrate-binding protein [Stellaceae bacterium]|jgi:multiple sugar transport system substrate-binding protein|nr:ABC transporter substrate-binding protein [Stellaceae bacterium]